MSEVRARNAADWEPLRVDSADPMPLYHQLKQQIREQAMRLEPDTMIPSEKELMDLAGVGRATVRRAISDLVQEGLLQTHQGRGTFTARPRIKAALSRPAGFTETMTRLGRSPSTRVLLLERIEAGPDVAAQLGVDAREGIFVIERLRLIDDEPCMVERTHMPERNAPGLIDQDLCCSLYDLLAREYKIEPATGTETVVAVNADRHWRASWASRSPPHCWRQSESPRRPMGVRSSTPSDTHAATCLHSPLRWTLAPRLGIARPPTVSSRRRGSSDGTQRWQWSEVVRLGAPPELALERVSKHFGAVVAVARATVAFRRGEITGLVGENGAGKSTLISLVTGAHHPDKGSFSVAGMPVRDFDPHRARDAGIYAIRQEPVLVPTLSVAENLLLGMEPSRRGIYAKRRANAMAKEWLDRVGASFSPATLVETLSPADRQLVEIARAVGPGAKYLFFDEPTSALGPAETNRLFALIRRLRDDGTAVVYVSHRLEEVFAICERVVVMRDGHIVADEPAESLDEDGLVALMAGQELAADLTTEHARRRLPDGPPFLTVDGSRARRSTPRRVTGSRSGRDPWGRRNRRRRPHIAARGPRRHRPPDSGHDEPGRRSDIGHRTRRPHCARGLPRSGGSPPGCAVPGAAAGHEHRPAARSTRSGAGGS